MPLLTPEGLGSSEARRLVLCARRVLCPVLVWFFICVFASLNMVYLLVPLPYLARIWKKNDTLRYFVRYQRSLRKHIHNKYRVDFLHSCLRNDLTPRFLKFRIPSNGCFEPTIVHNFHSKLLKKEISTASARVLVVKEKLGNARNKFLKHVSEATALP